MQRVIVIGCSGSGKSTLARKLASQTGLPLIHLDQEYWLPGWRERGKDEWQARVEELTQGTAWIIDGNFSATLRVRIAAADTIVFLDFPRWRCLARVLLRIARSHGKVRHDMAPGCPERLDWDFLQWIWNWPRHSRPQLLAALTQASGRVYVLQQPADITRFLAEIAT
jgi:adenylate kinase family enzyme